MKEPKDYILLNGNGSAADPFTAADRTAGIGTGVAALRERGGRLHLPAGQYDIEKTIELDTPSFCLSGDVWACNQDPNGVFESAFGTKIRMRGKDFPAIALGKTRTISGAIIRDMGIQGDISGMDTRPLVDFSDLTRGAGIALSDVRTDQCECSKISCCGLSAAVAVTGNAEVDACVFEKINADGCGVGFYFTPSASYYTHFRTSVCADTPYYGFYGNGEGKGFHNLELKDIHFVRNGGAFVDGVHKMPAAVCFDGISKSSVYHCLIDDAGTFWYYPDGATENGQRQPSHRKTMGLWIRGDRNRIVDNTILHSSTDSIRVEGNGNILISNIVDGNVKISGVGNIVSNLVFNKPDARLILEGDAKDSTEVYGVPERRIIRI